MKRSSESSSSFNLPKRWVIHTVAVSFVNYPNPELVLAQAIDAALRLANEQGIQSLAIPAIGTGVSAARPSSRPTTPSKPWHGMPATEPRCSGCASAS